VVPAADASSSVETVASFRRGRVHWVTWLVLLVVIGAALAVALVRGG
jgi:nitrate reductase NapE component